MNSLNTPPANVISTTTPEPRIFHTVIVFRCPSTMSERLAAYAARRGFKGISRAVRELLERGLQTSG